MPSRWVNMSGPVPSSKSTVLSIGTLPELLSLRHAVLESAGFQVFSTAKPEQAIIRIENGNCGVLLLCYSLDPDICKRLVDRFRRFSPEGRVVAVTNYPMAQPPLEADFFLYGVEGAEALINAVSGIGSS